MNAITTLIPDSTFENLFLTIMVIVASVAPIALSIFVAAVPMVVVGVVLWSLLKTDTNRQRLLTAGVPAQARVVTVGAIVGGVDTPLNFMNQGTYVSWLRIKLEVLPPSANGPTAPYAVEVKERVPSYAMPRFQPGAMVAVRLDPTNPMQLALDYRAMGYM